MKYFIFKNNKTVEVNKKNLKNYLNRETIFIYDDNLEVKGKLII